MRPFFIAATFGAAFLLPAACVTIIVNFPEAAVNNAAGQFVDKVIGSKPKDAAPASKDTPESGKPPAAALMEFLIPSARAQNADINVQTPQIAAVQARMTQRFNLALSKYYAKGVIGLTRDGLVSVRDAAGVPLSERASVNALVADENRDRQAVYREIALANGHAEWEAQIRAAFARQWIEHARSGWYYEDVGGGWKQK